MYKDQVQFQEHTVATTSVYTDKAVSLTVATLFCCQLLLTATETASWDPAE